LDKKLYSAAEVAAMRLPGLPTSKAAVIARAKAEGWAYEEQTGVGGKRRAYELPAKYLSKEQNHAATVVGTIAAGSAQIDPERMRVVVQALEDWCKARRADLPADRKAALISVLYDYVTKGAGVDEVTRLLQAMG
jgi:hypothetical protein